MLYWERANNRCVIVRANWNGFGGLFTVEDLSGTGTTKFPRCLTWERPPWTVMWGFTHINLNDELSWPLMFDGSEKSKDFII